MRLFKDRADAGRQLAGRLAFLRGQDVVVLGLPRGGVPVAFEVAEALRAPLDVLVVRKLGVPFQPELAFGAIGEGGVRVINESVVREADLSDEDMAAVEKQQRAELQRRSQRFRQGREQISLAGRVAVIVDDGIATGATAKAACQVARAHGASRVVLAVPIGAADTAEVLAPYADEVVCLHAPAFFYAVGQGYRNFTQTSDDEVVALRDAMGEKDFDSAWAEGAALSTEEAIAYAQRGRGQRKRATSGWASLTPTERDVVRLVSEGLGNKDIATRLFVSPRTVQTHLTHVYTTLGLSSRVQLVQEAARHG
jgi:putative phosphoribosyl transferase